VPVFAPVREHGFQNAIENYNGQWQAKVWGRYEFESLEQPKEQSERYVKAHRERSRARIEGAPERREFPRKWKYEEEEKISSGRIMLIRRTNDKGSVEMPGHKIEVASEWPNRLVRCEVEIKAKEIGFYRLRRGESDSQPLLRKVKYQLPTRHNGWCHAGASTCHRFEFQVSWRCLHLADKALHTCAARLACKDNFIFEIEVSQTLCN
jgi:hypothetical protein